MTALSLLLAATVQARSASMYWSNTGGGDLRRANLDGTEQKVLVSGPVLPIGPTLDLARGHIYWGHLGGGDMRRANLDGSGQEILIRNLNGPAGIALDVSNGHVYWANNVGGDIRRANLDGTDQKTLISGLNRPSLLTLDLSPLRTPDIQTVTQSDSAFTLNWSALLGRAYQVQFKPDLTQANWGNLILRLTATNTTMTAFDAVASDPQRFYRVVLLP